MPLCTHSQVTDAGAGTTWPPLLTIAAWTKMSTYPKGSQSNGWLETSVAWYRKRSWARSHTLETKRNQRSQSHMVSWHTGTCGSHEVQKRQGTRTGKQKAETRSTHVLARSSLSSCSSPLKAQLALWPSLVGPVHLSWWLPLDTYKSGSLCSAPPQISPNQTPLRQRYHSPYFTDKETRLMMVK